MTRGEAAACRSAGRSCRASKTEDDDDECVQEVMTAVDDERE